MEEVNFLITLKRIVWQILEVIVDLCKQFVHYFIKGWWIFVVCVAISVGGVLFKYKVMPAQYSVRTQLVFCGLNTPDFIQECEHIFASNDTTFVKPIKQEFVEIVDSYNDSIPDKVNWLYQTTHSDINHHLFPDRTYFMYITTNEKDQLEYLRTIQTYFRESEEYQARFQMERQQMMEEVRVLHAQVSAFEKSFEKGFVGNEYMPSIKSLYREMNYLDKKLLACKEPISAFGVTNVRSLNSELTKSLLVSIILGALVGFFFSLIWVNREKLLKK